VVIVQPNTHYSLLAAYCVPRTAYYAPPVAVAFEVEEREAAHVPHALDVPETHNIAAWARVAAASRTCGYSPHALDLE